MMASTIGLAVAATVAYLAYSVISGLVKHISLAKRTGLAYVVTPVSALNAFWLTTNSLWMPYLRKLPNSWTENWLPYLVTDWPWINRFEPYRKHGSDVLLTVSPGGIDIWVANAEAIHQISTRREAFPKPLAQYKLLDIFGRNVVTTEGPEWRQHRKVTAPGFNEKNMALVFAESCKQTEGMLSKWISAGASGCQSIESVPADAMRLTLHIISQVGFGVQLLWPGQTSSENAGTSTAVYSGVDVPEGHTMTYANALEGLLEKLLWVILLPEYILRRLPMKSAREAHESLLNWRAYMNELFAQKVREARDGERSEGMDIMGSLVKSSYGKTISSGQGEKGALPTLTDSEILGNAFVMILAGHETTANSVHFSLVELATNPRAQKLVHKEVESVYGQEPPKSWDYDKSINTLLGGILGAVLNEQLRIMPPVIGIPKSVTKNQDQYVTMDGKKVLFPAGCYLALNTIASHRNPKNWPSQPSKITGAPDDLDDFRPERWLVNGQVVAGQKSAYSTEDEEDIGGSTEEATSAQLFRPVKGSYIPFSEGARSCLGRRLAQVEMMAVFAVIFQKYSVELAVDEWATDDAVAKMSPEEKRVLYRKAQDKARQTLRGATSRITLKLHPGFIPLRVVKKGDERFINVVD